MTNQLNRFEIEDRILVSLKRRNGVATAGDVAADTGLGLGDVEYALRQMLSIYKSHLDVDDDGNLRYRFDPGFVRRGEEPARLWHDIKNVAWTGFQWFFKIWIMVTLVGYTVIFLVLLLAIAIASFAAAASSDSDVDDDLIGLPFYFFARVLEWLFWISLFDDSSSGRGRGRGRGKRRRKKPKPEKAFYQKIFDFVFGPEIKPDALAAQQAFASFIRQRDGVVTAAEWASRSGQSLEDAENALTAGVVRFNGDIDVSDNGSLLYRFDELKVSATGSRQSTDLPPIWTKRARVAPLTGNESGSNWWVGVLNLFNLIMATSVLFGLAGGELAIMIGLGWVPLVFSLIFFAVPAVRWVKHRFDSKTVERENARRQSLSQVYHAATEGRAITLEAPVADAMMRDYDGDIQVTESGEMTFVFERLATELSDARVAREHAEEVVFGRTVFSSDEEERSMDEVALEAFDEKLAIELGVNA